MSFMFWWCSIPDCQLLTSILRTLAPRYPFIKFLSIIGDHCIRNYPDRNLPTLLIYGKGDLKKQIVGIKTVSSEKGIIFEDCLRHPVENSYHPLIFYQDMENLLISMAAITKDLVQDRRNDQGNGHSPKDTPEDDDDDDLDWS